MSYAEMRAQHLRRREYSRSFRTVTFTRARSRRSRTTSPTAPAAATRASSQEISRPSFRPEADYTIPKQTPFRLTASATDADGDALQYCCEEYGLGALDPPNDDADGQERPILRSYPPDSPVDTGLPLARLCPRLRERSSGVLSRRRQRWEPAHLPRRRVAADDRPHHDLPSHGPRRADRSRSRRHAPPGGGHQRTLRRHVAEHGPCLAGRLDADRDLGRGRLVGAAG